MSVAVRRPRQREQSAAVALPLVIGPLRLDLTVERKPPACRAGERPLMRALVGRVIAARVPGRGGAERLEYPRQMLRRYGERAQRPGAASLSPRHGH